MQTCNGNVSEAARRLGVSRRRSTAASDWLRWQLRLIPIGKNKFEIRIAADQRG
jgi:hypothetical protein